MDSRVLDPDIRLLVIFIAKETDSGGVDEAVPEP
jgi:hypothetical protein